MGDRPRQQPKVAHENRNYQETQSALVAQLVRAPV